MQINLSRNEDKLLPLRVSGLYLRGDKLGKIDFRQLLERVKRAQIQYDRVITELKRLYCQRSVAGAVDAAVAAVIILMVFERGAGGIVRDWSFHCRACGIDRALHGMSAFMGTIERNGQHGEQQN